MVPPHARPGAIVISRNEGDWLRATVENLAATLPDCAPIVVVDDGSDDGSSGFLRGASGRVRLLRTAGMGVARARNLGASRCEADVLIFVDAHMRLPRGWWTPLVNTLRRPRAGAAAPAVADTTTPEEFGYGFSLPDPDLAPQWYPKRARRAFHAPILPGCCLAMPREVFERTGGFDEGLRARGGIDAETGLRLWLLGYECWLVPRSKVWHLFRGAAPYSVSRKDVLHNRLRLALCHLSEERLAQVLRALEGDADFPAALRLARNAETDQRRRALFSLRTHDDGWFFAKFGIDWSAAGRRRVLTDDDVAAIRETLTSRLGAVTARRALRLLDGSVGGSLPRRRA